MEVHVSSVFVVAQWLSHVQLFATPWTAARQAPLSFTNSQSLLKLMSIELMMPSNHLVLCRRLLLLPSIFPSTTVFSSEFVLCNRWQRIGASESVLPMNIENLFHSRVATERNYPTSEVRGSSREELPHV